MMQFQLTVEPWNKKSENEKNEYVTKFEYESINISGKENRDIFDGLLTIPKTPSLPNYQGRWHAAMRREQ